MSSDLLRNVTYRLFVYKPTNQPTNQKTNQSDPKDLSPI